MTISASYKKQNRLLHKTPGYGSSGHLWLGHVVELANAVNARSLIDYGAGKGTLGEYLAPFGIKYTPYDPATFPQRPEEPADMVVALDVLEHVEPEHMLAVLEDMRRLTGSLFFAVVSTRPATKELPDGRNAHLIVQKWQWWKPYLTRPWTPIRVREYAEAFDYVGGVDLPEKAKRRIRGWYD